MNHLFIINPAAGSRDRTAQYTEQIESVCTEKGIPYRIEVSTAPGECARIARKAAQTGEEYRIYSCGGDGTLNEIVSGVAGYPNVAVTMFAGGSGNDFIRQFDQPELFRDLNQLLDCKETEMDLLCCNDRYCLNICSVGLDARIGTDVANYKRIPLLSGFRAYAVSAVINTIRGIARHYVVEIDGKRYDEDFTMICICNGQYYGGGFHPVPDADPTDDTLEVLLITKVSRLQVLSVVGKYKNGKYKELPHLVRHIRTKSLRICCDKPEGFNLDGELLIADKMNISLAKEKIRFFHPKAASLQKQCAPV